MRTVDTPEIKYSEATLACSHKTWYWGSRPGGGFAQDEGLGDLHESRKGRGITTCGGEVEGRQVSEGFTGCIL